jgi:hypothetical protein
LDWVAQGFIIEIKRKGSDIQSKSYNTKWNKIEIACFYNNKIYTKNKENKKAISIEKKKTQI